MSKVLSCSSSTLPFVAISSSSSFLDQQVGDKACIYRLANNVNIVANQKATENSSKQNSGRVTNVVLPKHKRLDPSIQNTIHSCMSSHCPDLYELSKKLAILSCKYPRVSALLNQHPEFKLLKYLPVLTSIAEGLVLEDLEKSQPNFLNVLDRMSPESGPSLLGLLGRATRTKFLKMITAGRTNDRDQDLKIVSRLIQMGPCLDPDELEQLIKKRQALGLDKAIDAKVHDVDLYPPSYLCYFAFDIWHLVDAVLAQPISSQLQKLFTAAKKIPDEDWRAIALKYLYKAIEFLPEGERTELFDLMIERGQTEMQNGGKINWQTIECFTTVAEKTKCLNAKQLNTLITFIINVKDSGDHTELLCSLANAARLDQQLHSALTVALIPWQETDTLNGHVLRVLQIEQLSKDKEQLYRLVSDTLKINNPEKKAYMLGLLSGQMEYLDPKNRSDVVDAVVSLKDELEQITALCGAVIKIGYLEERDIHRLLNAIKAIRIPYQRAKILSILVGVVYEEKQHAGPGVPVDVVGDESDDEAALSCCYRLPDFFGRTSTELRVAAHSIRQSIVAVANQAAKRFGRAQAARYSQKADPALHPLLGVSHVTGHHPLRKLGFRHIT